MKGNIYMTSLKSLREIEDNLPSGFHDALLEALGINLPSNSMEMMLQLCVGDPDASTEGEREAYRRATLRIYDLVYLVIEGPMLSNSFSNGKALRIDGGDATDNSNPKAPTPRKNLPNGAFAYWFYCSLWNSFIHVAAHRASIQWEQ